MKYTLFGQTISFDEASQRFFDLQHASDYANATAIKQFADWYKKCGDIETVLKKYEEFTVNLLSELAFQPLFSQLSDCEVYDISQEAYWNRCIKFEEAADAIDAVEEKYLSIIGQQKNAQLARKYRKDSRGRFVGGGFGIGGAIKGSAKAATLNAATGLGHSAFNAIGNAGSAVSASMEKGSLYRNDHTRNILQKAIVSDLCSAFAEHIQLLNEHHPQYVRNIFDPSKSAALFDNAKKIPEKRTELLAQAVQFCPWNNELIRYIFINYPDDRDVAFKISERFAVNLNPYMEDMLAQEYSNLARSSEEEAQKARVRILQLMKKYHITESATLDQLDTDCLQRLCSNCANADTAECEQLTAAINQYPAQDKTKKVFLEKVKKRIDEIWSAEDSIIFDKLYLNINVSDPEAIAEARAYIQANGRTASSEKYIEALDACNPKMIKKARTYKYSKLPTVYLILALLSLVLCFFDATVVGIALAVTFFILRGRLKHAWNVLTLDGKVVHPVLQKTTATQSETAQEQEPEQPASGQNSSSEGQA